MIEEKRENSKLRMQDSAEFIDSAKDNLKKERFKAAVDHAIDGCIAANDAFTIQHLGKKASISHYEALDLHREASKKFDSSQTNNLRFLLDERHKLTYRAIKATKEQAETDIKKAIDVISWIAEHI